MVTSKEVELFSNEIEGMNSKEEVKLLSQEACFRNYHSAKQVTYSPQILSSSLSLTRSLLLLEHALSLFYHISQSVLTSWCNYKVNYELHI